MLSVWDLPLCGTEPLGAHGDENIGVPAEWSSSQNVIYRDEQRRRTMSCGLCGHLERTLGAPPFLRDRPPIDDLQRARLSGYERAELLDDMASAIQAAWRTDEIRRTPPKPQDEMRAGLSYFNETIFEGLPKFARRIDSALINQGLPRIPMEHSIMR